MAMTFEQLTSHFIEELEDIKSTNSDIVQQASKSVLLCTEMLSTLREQVVAEGFEDTDREIHFFKNVKSVPSSHLIYHSEVYKIMSALTPLDFLNQKRYIKAKLDGFQRFFLRNMDFGQYLESGSTHLDGHYYTRNGLKHFPISASKLYYQDPKFTSPRNMLLAQFKGYGRVVRHLQSQLFAIKIKASNGHFRDSSLPEMKWTQSKAALVELVYAIHSTGAVNEGAIDIKELATAFEKVFQTDLGNFYHRFVELRMRKTNHTKFMDRMKSSLLKRMEDADE